MRLQTHALPHVTGHAAAPLGQPSVGGLGPGGLGPGAGPGPGPGPGPGLGEGLTSAYRSRACMSDLARACLAQLTPRARTPNLPTNIIPTKIA